MQKKMRSMFGWMGRKLAALDHLSRPIKLTRNVQIKQ